MRSETINGQAAEICVIAADGTELDEGLTPKERDLLERLDAALQADAGFQAAHQGAALVRVDSNRGLADGDEGRFYLRYKHKAGMAEFWGNVGGKARVNLKRGVVCVAG